MGWTVRDRIPVGTRFSARPDRPWGPPSLLYNGYRVFPEGRGGRGVGLTPSPHLVPKVLEKSRAIPLPTLRACVAYKKGENHLPCYNIKVLKKLLYCTRHRNRFRSNTAAKVPNITVRTVQQVPYVTQLCTLNKMSADVETASHFWCLHSFFVSLSCKL